MKNLYVSYDDYEVGYNPENGVFEINRGLIISEPICSKKEFKTERGCML